MEKYLFVLLYCFSTTHLLSQPKTAKPTADTTIYTAVELPPQFPGGDMALSKFLMKNLRLPKNYLESGDIGQAFIQFIVEKDGSITNISFLRKIAEDFKATLVRLVKSMPKWIPGKMDNKPVRVKFILPIRIEVGEI